MEKWYWVELIGFDHRSSDYGVEKYLADISDPPYGISLFLYSSEFIMSYGKYNENTELSPEYCSYGARPANEDRKRQRWTHAQLKGLVTELKRHGIKTLFSTFSAFTYRDGNGRIVVGEFGEKHLDIRECISPKFGNFGTVSIIKRFADGTAFDEYFLAQIGRIIEAFGFDGVHFADGLSFPIRRIQDGDYSDDLVLRFSEQYGLNLPREISGRCDDDKECTLLRYRWILENHRERYTEFIASLYGNFYRLAEERLKGKSVLFMGAWTRDPFESLFRYGIDNKQLDLGKAHGFVFENMSASMPMFSVSESGGVEFSDAFRKDVQYHFFVTLLSLKAYTPEANVISLTPIRDSFEQWNLIENNPNSLAKGIALRNSCFLYRCGSLVKCNAGAMYCLADALQDRLWSFVNRCEAISDLACVNKVYGIGFVFHDDLSAELKDYIATRRLFSHEIRKRLVSGGITFAFASDLESLTAIDQPLVITGLENYSDEELSALENHRGVFAVIGYGKSLGRKADAVFTLENSALKCEFYNLPYRVNSNVIPNEKHAPDLSPFDEAGGIWTAKLKFEEVNPEFFREIARVLNGCDVPSVDDANCRMMLFGVNDGYKAYLYNNANKFCVAKVSLPIGISSAKALVHTSGLQSFGENFLTVKLYNDGAEIIEMQ